MVTSTVDIAANLHLAPGPTGRARAAGLSRISAILTVMNELEKPSRQELAVQAVGATFAGLIGLVIGGPVGVLAGAALTPFGIQWIKLAAAEWTQNSNLIAKGAIEASGIEDADEFFQLMEEDPGLTALAQRILFAARMTSNQRKLRALGQLLGGVVAGRGDHLDEAELLAKIIGDIEEPQVVTLDILTREPDDAAEQRERERERVGEVDPEWEPTWLLRQVQAELPMDPDLALPCLSDLARQGLAETLGTYGGGWRYKISPFGRSLAAVMARAAAG